MSFVSHRAHLVSKVDCTFLATSAKGSSAVIARENVSLNVTGATERSVCHALKKMEERGLN